MKKLDYYISEDDFNLVLEKYVDAKNRNEYNEKLEMFFVEQG